MKPRKERRQPSPLDLIEEAVHLLRRSPSSLFAAYFLGSFPFFTGFLYYWADMSRSALAASRLEEGALVLSLLFLWMKGWHTVFALGLFSRLNGEPWPRWSLRRAANMFAVQAFVQSTAFIVLPLAALFMLPFGWAVAFYQNVTLLGDGSRGLRETVAGSWRQSCLWSGQNHLVLSVISLYGLFVLLNVLLAVAIAPFLLKTLLGFESVALSGSWHVMNSTFLAVSCVLAWICVDPLVKTVYVLRCFYGLSLRSGMDLQSRLREVRGASAAIIAFICILGALPAAAGATADTFDAPALVVPADGPARSLDLAISDVLESREYAWRFPRVASPAAATAEKNMFQRFAETVGAWLKKGIEAIGDAVSRFLRWLERIFPAPKEKPRHDSVFDRMPGIQALFFILAILVGSVFAVGLYRAWSRRGDGSGEAEEPAVVSESDLGADDIVADALPPDRWMALASELRTRGEMRLALRALYLGTLAHLAERELVTVARSKTNRDYRNELFRRARSQPNLLTAFGENVALFDRVWYGTHEASENSMDLFMANIRKIGVHAL